MPDTPAHKVGYVLKMYPRFSETFIVTEILAREQQGLDIEIYSLRPPIDPRFHDSLARVTAPVHYIPRMRKAADVWEQLQRAGAELGTFDDDTLRLLLAADADDAGQALDVAVRARRDGITHLHAHFASIATTVARLAARLAGITYSFTAHAKDLFHSEVDSRDVRSKAEDAHHVVTISQYNVAHLRQIGAPEDCLNLVYNGLDLDVYTPRPSSNSATGVRIVAVGRLIEKKGLEYLIDACDLLHRSGSDFSCEIVGGGEREDALRQQAAAFGLNEVVRFHGPLPQDRVRDVVASADVLAAPCVVGTDGNTDGLPTVVLEAMALGTVCVTTDVTGLVEAVHHEQTGLVVPQHDASALATAIMRIGSDPDLAQRCRSGARDLIESTFDSRRQAVALNALLPKLEAQGVAA